MIILDEKTKNPTPVQSFVEELSIPIGVYCLSWICKNRKGDISHVCEYFSTEEEALDTAKIHYLCGSDEDDAMCLTKLTGENRNIKSNTFFWKPIKVDFSHLKDKRLTDAQRKDYVGNINKFFGAAHNTIILK